jgi:hypothetical protein
MYCPIGISGSGKSFLGKLFEAYFDERLVTVCPDDVRRELTGDISDQSRNAEVFSVCHRRVRESLRGGKDVYFSATNLSKKDRDALVDIARSCKGDAYAFVLEDSKKPEICKLRVGIDLQDGVDRSNTLVLKEGKTVIDAQHTRFMSGYPFSQDSFKKIFFVDGSFNLFETIRSIDEGRQSC